MIRPEHPFDIRPDLRKAVSVIRPNQLVRPPHPNDQSYLLHSVTQESYTNISHNLRPKVGFFNICLVGIVQKYNGCRWNK